MPLIHRPGEAQVDFGHALVKLNGVLVKRPYFVMALPYSDAFFVQMFERESHGVRLGRPHPGLRVFRRRALADQLRQRQDPREED